jgi:hypothetical protein
MKWNDIRFKDADWILSAEAVEQWRTVTGTRNF